MTQGRFHLEIADFARKAGANMDEVLRKVALDMYSRIVLRSPVDTGFFRANWQVALPPGIRSV